MLVLVLVSVLEADEGDEEVELELLLLEPEAGVEAVLLVFVVLDELLLLSEPPGFTTVVLFSVFFSGVAGAVVSVFCSHAARSAALARMQMYFFIGFGCSCPLWVTA